MKNFTFLFAAIILVLATMAQAPQAISYQAVARSLDGDPVINQEISVKISILSESASGNVVYSETHSVETNSMGLFTLEIGNPGLVLSGSFQDIPWGVAEYFLKLEIDENGGANYQLMGVSQLLSVPYSLNSGSLTLTDDNGNTYDVSVDTSGNLFATIVLPCGIPIVDARDGQTYETVQIGGQCWMAENLTWLPSVSHSYYGSDTSPYYYVYSYQGTNVAEAKATDNFQNYGVLYNWPSSRMACPQGWHLPTDAQWALLIDFLGGDDVAGGKMKSTRTAPEPHPRWTSPNTGATNTSGFSGLPGGRRNANGTFNHVCYTGYWWSSTGLSPTNTWVRTLDYSYAGAGRSGGGKDYGFSVRCLKYKASDNQPPGPPSSPNPEDGAVNQLIEVDLSWACTDPEADPLSYDIYFGTEAAPPQVATGQTATTYDPGTLVNNTEYFWKIVAHDNYENTTEGPVWSFTTEVPWQCGVPFTDGRDGQTYETVLIGGQCWMAENLAYLPSVSPSSQGNNTDPYYYVFNYQGTNVATAKVAYTYQKYGALYNWPASLTSCPTDWHLPTKEEWTVLTVYLGGQDGAGGKMKSTRTDPDPHPRWRSPNWGANNSSGFSGLPGGYRKTDGSFYNIGSDGYWWSSLEVQITYAYYLRLEYDDDYAILNFLTRGYGYSVRCLRD
ncbi:MAG: hypothetical protein B6D61_13770 [Bacteroidetes bacterium 4484_249]|nr:MAG: hypothetical protein B6D61_13770 [Bacteroidetes bacterium 4484_249]